MRLLFTLTIFLGSALLFLIQPIIAKIILPVFGGSSAVWTSSVLFFQLLLLAGYAYAHGTARLMDSRKQAFLHVGLALIAALTVKFGVGKNVGPPSALAVLLTLATSIGFVFWVQSACAPLIQRWFATTDDPAAADPYFLYAASNCGSLLALVSYPFLIEPNFTLSQQGKLWTVLFCANVGLLALCAFSLRRSKVRKTELLPVVQTDARQKVLWALLAAVPVSLMLGLTSFATINVAPIPLFWIGPLALYLLTYIIAFSHGRALGSRVYSRLLPLVVVPLALVMILESDDPLWLILIIHAVAFCIAALMCHTRLAESRPPAGNLTEFYLWLSIGGAIGGLFNALVAPTAFATLAEYPIAVVAACALRTPRESDRPGTRMDLIFGFAILCVTIIAAGSAKALGMDPSPVRTGIIIGIPIVLSFFMADRVIRFAAAIGAVFLGTQLMQVSTDHRIIFADRSFFGVHRVLASSPDRMHLLAHGTTLHGIQDKLNPRTPLTYYTTNGPIGEVFSAYHKKNVGLVGLGAGSCAAYGLPGDNFTFFEIDPLVVEIAENNDLFTFLRDSKAKVEIVLGDARLALQTRRDGEFGLLVLDAFSSDAIPVHLLTQQAMRLYFSKVAEDGIVAFHISNRMLNLEPVIARIAQAEGVEAFALEASPTETQSRLGMRASIWMVLARDKQHVSRLVGWRPATPQADTPLWTDDYSNILSAWSAD